MAKRFTDSTKWSNSFIRSLKAPYKLLWLYILDECDHAGVWQVDIDVAQIKIGEKINKNDAEKLFKDKIHVLKNGEKWFIIDFIEFQYGELNSQNRAHNSVINILKKYDIIDEFNKIKPLISPLIGAMDMDKDKDMVKDMVKVKDLEIEKIEKTEIELLFDEFLKMRVKIKKPATEKAIQLLKKKLNELSGGNEMKAIKIIEQSIVGGRQDFYELKQIQGKEDSKTSKLADTYYTLLNEIKNESGEIQ